MRVFGRDLELLMLRVMSLVPELRADAFSARAFPVLSSGLVSGVYILIYVIVASLVLGSALLWGDLMLMSIPVPLVGGLLVFIRVELIEARFTARDRHSNKIRPRHGRGAAERLAASDDGPGIGIRFHGCAAVPVWSG